MCVTTPNNARDELHEEEVNTARAHHETVNGHLKNWKSMSTRLRRNKDKHHLALRAVAVAEPIKIMNGRPPFQCDVVADPVIQWGQQGIFTASQLWSVNCLQAVSKVVCTEAFWTSVCAVISSLLLLQGSAASCSSAVCHASCQILASHNPLASKHVRVSGRSSCRFNSRALMHVQNQQTMRVDLDAKALERDGCTGCNPGTPGRTSAKNVCKGVFLVAAPNSPPVHKTETE